MVIDAFDIHVIRRKTANCLGRSQGRVWNLKADMPLDSPGDTHNYSVKLYISEATILSRSNVLPRTVMFSVCYCIVNPESGTLGVTEYRSY